MKVNFSDLCNGKSSPEYFFFNLYKDEWKEHKF